MRKRLLIIDDDPGILDALQEIFQEIYTIKTIGRADKIFEEIDAFKPDLILMDVMISGMDGRNICKTIKSEEKYLNIPVILISANTNAYGIMFEQGAPDDFLAKPFDVDDLLNRVASQLGV